MAELIFTMGLPGSGKSTWARNYRDTVGEEIVTVISSDDIRQELWGDANDQREAGKVFEVMFQRTVVALNEGKTVIYDATNLNAKKRESTLLRIKRTARVPFVANLVLTTCPISECKLRQSGRDRKVPDEVIDRMVRQFEAPWYNEGWHNIHVVHTGKEQNVDHEHWRMLGESHDNPHHTTSLEIHCANCEFEMKELLPNTKFELEYSKPMCKALIEAAYHHDIGKHKTKVFHDMKGNPTDIAHYYFHNNVGAYLWLSGDKIREWDEDDFLLIGVLIQWHMQPFFMRDEDGEWEKNFFDWCNKRGFAPFIHDGICLLHQADRAAH